MSTPLVTFADPARAVVDYLTSALAGRSEPYLAGVAVGIWYPPSSSTGAPSVPFVQVVNDGTPVMSYPVFIRSTIRVVCWHTGPTAASQLASLVLGLLATHPGDAKLWRISPYTGPLPGRDDDTGTYLNSLTFGVSVRPAAA